MPGTLNHDNFAARLNEVFTVAHGAATVELTLAECTRISPPGAPHEAFSLLFHGPRSAPLPQQIHALHNATMGEIHIFLVPLGPEDGVFQYEAIFN